MSSINRLSVTIPEPRKFQDERDNHENPPGENQKNSNDKKID